ncbi:hypothetical protein SAMN05216221_1965 [Pseudomonas oryzae]|uniref:Uncharacterized protein n=1 Tax=Pseudomonas oryzae TaxID=1392877 RepID=A0A1H1SRQ8_9PSED|nr:hypothetical protein SAMN05216221_1965 [Pseudomonas oryzae]
MTPAVQTFLDCCQRILHGDAALIEQLRAAGFACTPASWTFSLPALHAFLAPRLATGETLEYRAFVRQLFASRINLELHERGAEIAIADNRGKVSASLYCLRRRPA